MDQNITGETALFQQGQALRAMGNWEGAVAALEAASICNPHRPETLLSLGVLHLQRNQLRSALALLHRSLAERPDYAQAWNALGHTHAALGDHCAAFDAFTLACAHAPVDLAFTLHRAEAALNCHQASNLRQIYESEAELNPLAVAPLLGLGLLCIRERQTYAAIDVLEAAAALDTLSAEPPMLLGIAYSLALQPARAAPLLRQALDRDPDNAGIANDLAVTLSRLYRYEEGVALLNASIAKFGPSVVSLSNLATAQAALGEMDAAISAAQLAMLLAPKDTGPQRAWCNLLPYQDNISGAYLRAALECAAQTLPLVQPQLLNASRQLAKPLRIGLLSNVLRTHPVGWLTLAGLEALDRDAFSVHCFGRFDGSDAMANRFARFAASWHQIETMDDASVATLIREQNIDILIDLGGFGDAGRINVCALRPAPLQIKWVGMQYHTTGLNFIDYFISDQQETPPGYDAFYTEKLLRLPDGYVCYLPPSYAPDVSQLPARKTQHITFGCLNNLMKITPATLKAWGAILNAIPDSHLRLRCPQFSDPGPRNRITQALAEHGISPTRLYLSGRAAHREFLATYNEVDIALDPFPYSGGLSTCEALYMGVPVLTCAGEIFAARHSVSHLANVGLPNWIAATTDDYIAKAITFASDIAALENLRAGLRRCVVASPLCNAPRFGAALGQALRRIWVDYCATDLV
jgi:predicted O-linked N-acetylglucosamine transferase (SPINDLY family)